VSASSALVKIASQGIPLAVLTSAISVSQLMPSWDKALSMDILSIIEDPQPKPHTASIFMFPPEKSLTKGTL
jgi:hypothetical protein